MEKIKTDNMSIIDFNKIQQLMDEWAVLNQNLDLAKNENPGTEPEAPIKIDSQQEWENYNLSVRIWRGKVNKKDEDINAAEKAIEKHMGIIRQWVPANTWVKTRTCYVGYQTDSWPGYVPFVQIKPLDADLPRLKHHHTQG